MNISSLEIGQNYFIWTDTGEIPATLKELNSSEKFCTFTVESASGEEVRKVHINGILRKCFN